jgi:uncharacterized protein (TIGR00369 family)
VTTESFQDGLEQVRGHAHPNCAICSPSNERGLHLEFSADGDGRVQARFECEAAFEGYASMLHGGVLASLMDGAMTNCMFAHGATALTAELNVRYRHPVLIGTPATVRAWIDRSSPPLHVLKAEIVQGAQVKATACGKFMEQNHLAPGKHRCQRIQLWA